MSQQPSDTQDLSEVIEQAEDISPERNALDRLVARGARGAAWMILLAMAISVVEVFLRYGFNNPTSWVHESVVFLVAVSFALGGPAAMAKNSHIRVKVLYDNAGARLKGWMDRFNDLVTLGFCLTMSYAAFHMFWRASHNPLGEWQLERSGTSWNPPFPALVKGVILFALALMTLQATLHLIQSLRARPATTSTTTAKEGR
ncbi:C4-dicarboxylate ABC transporter permease [Litchfieldella anticariensis FP35 = DSM 16096]|uniref:TRAP transporter small permease protein n=1 Tax=Litchfieldella anticariensis (strain DSM 16096 / CECT 5854 / CIP 108499 / LMG 22089 / FP35) TaxID=1121939 RepID=S2KGF7_LITA3|nr:TRAP transporter small permease [Halomonas anticariensis]EPC01217.1 C4-dicarboxylate ABC transporter permease [Halomonas anticariensis FP35 = DSM 16096]